MLTRHDDETPTLVSVEAIRLLLDTEYGEVAASPTLINAIGRQLDTEDISVFAERQGIAKLAAALHYTLRVIEGELTQRTAATALLNCHTASGSKQFYSVSGIF